MKSRWMCGMALSLAALAVPSTGQQQAQQTAAQTGAIEFVVQVAPTGGRPELVMKLAVSLLRRSFAEIHKEAEQGEPKPDMDKFIEGLEVSQELKEWMKRTRSVELSGTEFAKKVTTDDIFNVPEFFEAYMARNVGDTTTGFPVTKAREKDRTENPQRYAKAQQEYRQALRKFVETKPYSRDGMEVELASINPAQRWAVLEGQRRQRIRDRALELTETTYLVVKTETDLEGRGAFSGVLAGNYWLSTGETEAIVGDARLRWDTPVPVRGGRVTRVTLSNVNAVRKDR